MENVAKALGIAGGVLLAVIIMSLIVYVFSSISEWPQQEDDIESEEQLAEFNKEYEVYDKSLMYGVDVISCLNKAKSNNEKYVEGNGLLTGSKYPEDYYVNVYVKLAGVSQSDNDNANALDSRYLNETIEVWYFDKEENSEIKRTNISTDVNLKIFNRKGDNGQIEQLLYDRVINANKYLTLFEEDDYLYTQTKYFNPDYITDDTISMKLDEEYALEDYDNNEYNDVLKQLLGFSQNPKITIKNTNSSTLNYWSKIVWSTALYNFKTRRFTCKEIKYSEKTGRVSEIHFEEYNNN